ncbi:MAG: ATP-NAD kinase family protein [Candidatus Altiarchaeota archaeon]
MKIGFLVNPIAGLGGRVGLKGTDGKANEAKLRGAEPVSPIRAAECLEGLRDAGDSLDFLTCSGSMGSGLLEGFRYEVVLDTGQSTSSKDTKNACVRFIERGVELILFAGGDGTLRDVFSAVGDKVPVVGIPAGVKMHSGAFAVNPHASGKLVLDYANGSAPLRDAEVIDVDEEAYRAGELRTRLFGYVKTPFRQELIQAGKRVFSSVDDEESKYSIAVFASEFMRDGSAYILGAGSTTAAIAKQLGIEKTLLGVDVVKKGRLLVKDASERELVELLKKESKAKIIVSPIGAQGFVFGRGTQQISPHVIRMVGAKNVIYVATPVKLNTTPQLLVDTSDRDLDRELSGYRSVVIGYRLSQRKDVKSG